MILRYVLAALLRTKARNEITLKYKWLMKGIAMNVNYKKIMICAVIGASMQNAWGMYRQGYNQFQYPQQRSNVSNNNNQPSYPNAPLKSPSNSIRPSNNNNANMPVAPNATNSNNPPPYAPSSAPLVENDSIARLAAAIEVMNKNMERIAASQDKVNKNLERMNDSMERIASTQVSSDLSAELVKAQAESLKAQAELANAQAALARTEGSKVGSKVKKF